MADEQAVTIKGLIVAAAEGAAAGVDVLKSSGLSVELQEFEIEVNYSCTTEFSVSASVEAQMSFMVFKAKFSAETSYKRTTTYGLKVRFVFTSKEKATT